MRVRATTREDPVFDYFGAPDLNCILLVEILLYTDKLSLDIDKLTSI